MIGKSVYKVPNGKLVKVTLEFENEKILSVIITGDFFLYPENGIEVIENSLNGADLNRKDLVSKINQAVEKNKLELFGIDADGIVEAINLAEENSK